MQVKTSLFLFFFTKKTADITICCFIVFQYTYMLKNILSAVPVSNKLDSRTYIEIFFQFALLLEMDNIIRQILV